jgi:pilus assembly protein CpaE
MAQGWTVARIASASARMRAIGAQRMESERGQATVEFVGILPAALLVAALVVQLVLAGHAVWSSGNAARVAARAAAVGGDPAAAARSALPSYLERGLKVSTAGGSARRGAVTVRVRLPLLATGRRSPFSISARAAMEPQSDGG